MMNSTILVLCFSIVSIVIVNANNSNNVIEKNKLYAKQCLLKFPVNNSSFEDMYTNYTVPDDKNLKCFLGCILTKLRVIKSKHIDWRLVRRTHRRLGVDQKTSRKIDILIKRCKKEVIPDFKDVCKLAASFTSCKMKYSRRFNIPVMKMRL
ncbi:hypothetical protein O3M35_010592 [Rhynocoris fuscipes]|uniref:Uncharacterized protein n=1 Tax=Rhynocoris fuscipes TaxID=488301 RepID=A0AAW1D5L8_9HEMI